jgi:hypothetical protein
MQVSDRVATAAGFFSLAGYSLTIASPVTVFAGCLIYNKLGTLANIFGCFLLFLFHA